MYDTRNATHEELVMAHRYLYYVKATNLVADQDYDVHERMAILQIAEDHPLHKPGSSVASSYTGREKRIAKEMLLGARLPWQDGTVRIFVFGSNLAGRHGKGSALMARTRYGAQTGRGVGIQGQSYAIPTKDMRISPLPLRDIRGYVEEFVEFSAKYSEWDFDVVRVGCELAGYKDKQIAPFFSEAGPNVKLPDGWRGMKNDDE